MSDSESIPRDPEHYWPTEHCVLRRRKRGIEWDEVSETIATGRVNNDYKNDTCVFTKEIDDELMYVATNHENGAITSIWKNDEQP